jgi:hypothetical protein
MESIPSLENSLPTGSWTLYYHHPADHRWTLDSYQKIITVKTWGEFFACMNALEDNVLQNAMLFWMREDIPPLYENHNNIRGGCYSLRVNRSKSSNFFLLYTISCMLGNVVLDKDNLIQGISISPKRVIEKSQVFNVIKIWNKDCTKFKDISQLVKLDNIQTSSEIIYTPHIQKKL